LGCSTGSDGDRSTTHQATTSGASRSRRLETSAHTERATLVAGERYGAHGNIVVNASAYWLTNTIGSSVRRYYDEAHAEHGRTEPTTTPTGVAIFANDFQSIRGFAERDHANIVSWNRYRGSHFSPHDAPDLLLDDLRQFFRTLR
jgi:hypothetical protein